MPDNRSLWSDGPAEDEHHGWLNPENDAPASSADAPTGRPLSSEREAPTRVHRAEGQPTPPPRPPRQGPPARERVRTVVKWPLVALCAIALLASGIAIGTRILDQNTVERTVVSGGSGNSATSSQIKAAYEAAHEGVVFIRAGDASGSGWVYDDQGTIVTNNHVVADANGNVQVRFKDDGSLIQAKVLGTDVSSDLAVLRVNPRDVDKLVPLKVADSNDVETGDPAIAIGYPLGLDQTTTAGIISGIGRQIPAQNNFQIDSVLQTDAPINSGNSGGPLLNAKGEVVGVNSQIATASAGGGSIGIGYAIPSDTVEKVVPKLENGGSIEYPYLGVVVGDTETGGGAAVISLQPGSPAARAGLQAASVASRNGLPASGGDVILKIDGKTVSRSSDVTGTINQRRPGDKLRLEVRRGGQTRTVEVTLGTRPRTSTPSTTTTTPSSPSNPRDPTNPAIPTIP